MIDAKAKEWAIGKKSYSTERLLQCNIEKLTYDNEKYKNGIAGEFDEVIKIYNENYKPKND